MNMTQNRSTLSWMAGAILMLLGSPDAALAGQSTGSAQPRPAAKPPVQAPATVDANRLPIDLHRIERQLRQSSIREQRNGLNLRYVVDVYGRAPRIELFTTQDVLPGQAIPYGAPTHREMVDVMTPKEYRAPAMDFASAMRWLSEKMK